MLVGSTARTIFKASHVVADLHQAMNQHGRPERMLTDNGAVFTGRFRGRGWVAPERELVALGIGLSHIGRHRAHTRILMLIRELDIRIVTEETGEHIRDSPWTLAGTTSQGPRV
jgi:hypothetical protein